MKKTSTMQRLFAYAGNFEYLTIASWILSAISAGAALVPFYYIWKLMQEVLSKLIQNKTVLIIAHRMRTVADADKIVVLKDGVVAEQGSPAELEKKDGIYRHMMEMQMKAENWKL